MSIKRCLRARAMNEILIAEHALTTAALLFGYDSAEYEKLRELSLAIRKLRGSLSEPVGKDLADAIREVVKSQDGNALAAAVPEDVRVGGWQWRPVDADTAFAPPFSTIRVCRACGCLVAGGPTACGRCVAQEEAKPAKVSP